MEQGQPLQRRVNRRKKDEKRLTQTLSVLSIVLLILLLVTAVSNTNAKKVIATNQQKLAESIHIELTQAILKHDELPRLTSEAKKAALTEIREYVQTADVLNGVLTASFGQECKVIDDTMHFAITNAVNECIKSIDAGQQMTSQLSELSLNIQGLADVLKLRFGADGRLLPMVAGNTKQ